MIATTHVRSDDGDALAFTPTGYVGDGTVAWLVVNDQQIRITARDAVALSNAIRDAVELAVTQVTA